MEISALYAANSSDDPQKLITLQYLIDNPNGGGEGPGLGGTNYLFVNGSGTPSENAVELQAAYNTAKGMSPAIANVITVVVAPGKYTFGATKFEPDTAYINIVSLTGNPDVLLDGINVTTDNVFLKGLNCGENKFECSSSLDNLILENCIGGDSSFGGAGTFSGTATNCTGGDNSFGSGETGIFSGTATNCSGGYSSFGSGGGIFSGEATNCTGGDNSFGGYGTFSGTATSCTGGDYSFGGGGEITSTARLYYCRLTSASFESPEAGGKFVLCIDGNDAIVTTA